MELESGLGLKLELKLALGLELGFQLKLALKLGLELRLGLELELELGLKSELRLGRGLELGLNLGLKSELGLGLGLGSGLCVCVAAPGWALSHSQPLLNPTLPGIPPFSQWESRGVLPPSPCPFSFFSRTFSIWSGHSKGTRPLNPGSFSRNPKKIRYCIKAPPQTKSH